MPDRMLVFKLLIFNSFLFIIDSGMDGYVRVISFPHLLLLYIFSLTDVIFIGYLFMKAKRTRETEETKKYFKNSKGYTCLEHNLYDMGYIEATAHFGLQHNMTLDEVEDE